MKKRGIWIRDLRGTVWEQDSCHRSMHAAYLRLKKIKQEKPHIKTKLCVCNPEPLKPPNGKTEKEICIYTVKIIKR